MVYYIYELCAYFFDGYFGNCEVYLSLIHFLGLYDVRHIKRHARQSAILQPKRRTWHDPLHLLRQNRHPHPKHHGIQEVHRRLNSYGVSNPPEQEYKDNITNVNFYDQSFIMTTING